MQATAVVFTAENEVEVQTVPLKEISNETVVPRPL